MPTNVIVKIIAMGVPAILVAVGLGFMFLCKSGLTNYCGSINMILIIFGAALFVICGSGN